MNWSEGTRGIVEYLLSLDRDTYRKEAITTMMLIQEDIIEDIKQSQQKIAKHLIFLQDQYEILTKTISRINNKSKLKDVIKDHPRLDPKAQKKITLTENRKKVS